MFDPQRLLSLAERVASVAASCEVQTALIGAAAMAVHNAVRATHDVDLASSVDPYQQLHAVEAALRASGLQTRLALPDELDPLGGVLRAWELEDQDEDGDPVAYVEIVNFFNPHRVRPNPARTAIARAVELANLRLRSVTMADLIALKLDAGGYKDYNDIVTLLRQNPHADLDEIRAIASPYDRDHKLDELVAASRP